MISRARWIADQTRVLEARQAALIAEGTPDEFIPVQITQLGHV